MKLTNNIIQCLIENDWAISKDDAETLTRDALKSFANDLEFDIVLCGDDDFMVDHVNNFKKVVNEIKQITKTCV